MSTHPYIPLYVDDYDAATTHLTAEEDGVYCRLLRLCWRTPGCSIPADPAWIARKIRLSADDYERVVKPVLEEFFKLSRGRYVQKRLRDEYDTISRKKLLRQNAGKKGGEAKSRKEKEKLGGNASDLPPDMRALPEPEPEPIEDSPPAPQGGETKIVLRRSDLNAIWSETPRVGRERSSRDELERALQAAARRGHAPADVRLGVANYYRSDEATREDGRFAKGVHRVVQHDRWLSFTQSTPIENAASAPDPDDRWRRALRGLKANQYWNTTDDGPRPGKPGCIVPARLLVEFDITPVEAGQLLPFQVPNSRSAA